MHATLQRQIKKFFGNDQNLPKDTNAWLTFLQAINQTYAGYEEDHALIERSLEISSKELNEQNQKLQENGSLLAQKVTEAEAGRARDEAILGSIGDGVVVTDEQGKILVVNYGVQALLGISSQDLINKSIFEAYQLYDKDGNLVPVQKRPIAIALEKGEKTEAIFAYRYKDGTTFFIDIHANPVMQSGKIIGVVALFRDVTEQKAIDRMKTEFISLASHQLRTPLSAVKWYAEMLLSGDAGKVNEEQEDFVKNIYDSTERMIDLVNSLLNISRIESGRIVIEPHPTDLKEMVEGLVKEMQQTILKKELKFIISVHEQLPKISIDPKLIRQVYLNLLTNAIKYTDKGGEISIFISRKGEDIISQVTDTGYGIPKKQQPQIFQKFFRADNAAKKETVGTGLGLYLARAIVESSNGKIWFASEEGKGATFWFTLPVAGIQPKKGEVTLD